MTENQNNWQKRHAPEGKTGSKSLVVENDVEK